MDIIFKIKEESEFKAVVEETITNCYNTNTDISYNSAKEEIRTIIKTTNCDSSALEKILLQICDNQERVSYVINVIECKKRELLYLSLIYYNSKYGEAVSDFDWILKFVSGTSELKKLKYPLLQLSLTTNKNGTETQKTFDISKDMLAKLIDVLETTDV